MTAADSADDVKCDFIRRCDDEHCDRPVAWRTTDRNPIYLCEAHGRGANPEYWERLDGQHPHQLELDL